MNTYACYRWIFMVTFTVGFVLLAKAGPAAQDDTVKVALTENPPTIDGDPGDACWDAVAWQSIDQVWIPYGDTVPASDFSGRFKICWSQQENVLYMLAEIIDDVFVDGYVYPNDGYPDYDIFEVFIDEDKSGGLHVFDGTGTTGQQWGTNAENAFSYHIVVECPADGEVTTECVVCDIAGTDWGNKIIPNYANHFPAFAMKKSGSTYYWEFSLVVYNDTYDDTNPEASRVQLSAGKVMGLSVAYCDNDDPTENPKTRDNFFGSVKVTAQTYNDHWMQADGFGTARLMPAQSTKVNDAAPLPRSYFAIWPNPSHGMVRLLWNNSLRGDVRVQLYDIIGREVYATSVPKQNFHLTRPFHLPDLVNGLYLLHVQCGQRRDVQKLMINHF